VVFYNVLKKASYIFLPLFIIISALSFSLYKKEKNIINMELEHNEKRTVALQKETIRNEIDHIVSNLLLLSREFELHMSNGGIFDESIAFFKNELIIFSDSLKSYDQVRLLDKKGMEVIRINLVDGKSYLVPDKDLQSKGDRYYFHETLNLERSYIYISPFDLNIEHGRIEKPFKPVIRLGTPVYYENGKKYGIIIFNYLGEVLLKSFEKLNDMPGRISMLMNMEGYWFSGPSPEDEWGFMFEERKKRTFGNRFREAWAVISGNDSGQFYNREGIFTFNTINPLFEAIKSNPLLESTGRALDIHSLPRPSAWKIVSLVPGEVIAAKTDKVLKKFLLVYAFLVFPLLFVSWQVARISIQRKLWQETLEKSEAGLRTAQNIARMGNWEWDTSGGKIYWSEAFFHILGLDAKKHAPGMKTFLKLVHPGDRAYVKEKIRNSLKKKEALNMDHRMILPDSSEMVIIHDHGEMISDDGKKTVKIIGTIQDVTAQKKIEEALLKNNHLLDAIRSAQEKCIMEKNVPPPFKELLAHLLSLSNSEGGFIGEVIISKGLSTLNVVTSAFNFTGKKTGDNASESPDPAGINPLFEALVLKGERIISNHFSGAPHLRELFRSHPLINAFIAIPIKEGHRVTGMIGMANRPGGYDDELLDFLDPFIRTYGNIIKAYKNNAKRFAAERKLLKYKENLEKLVGKRTAELANTNRALQKSEALYHSLVDNMNEGLGMVDKEGTTTYANSQFGNIIGYPLSDIIGKHWTSYFDSTAREEIEAELKKRKKGIAEPYEVENRRKDGKKVWLRISPKVMLDPEGRFRGSMGLFQDITDRKLYEEALKKREEELGERIKELNCLYGMSKLIEAKGITLDEILEGTAELLTKAWQYPEICCAAIFFEGKAFKTARFRKTKWCQTAPVFIDGKKAGQVEVCYLKKTAQHNESPFLKEEEALINEIAERTGSISKRIEVEKALAESEAKYRGLFNNAQVGLWRISAGDGKLLECNERLARIFGYSNRKEAMTHFIASKNYLDPGKREEMLALIKKKGEINNFEARLAGKEGLPIWVRFSAKLYADKDFLEGVATDITEEKEALEALQKSEEQFRQVVDKSPVPMVITDSKGYIENFNSKFIELFGWTTKEVRTPEQWWNAAYPDGKYRNKVRRSWEKAVNEATLKKMEIPPQQWQVTCKNGDLREVEFRMVPISEKRNVIAMNDITERKKDELKIRNSREQMRALALHLQDIREEERSAIARDIHDELGQVLTACKFDLSWIGTKLNKKQEELLERVKESTEYMDRAIQFVKKIATELRPALLDDVGLMAAVEWQAREFERKTGIKCHVEFRPWRIILSRDLSTAVFRIFQEALTNVSRHSEASAVNALLEGQGPNLVLEVKDNGKGMSDEDMANSKSYGIIGMKERLFPWGGNVTIYGKKKEGTTVRVIIPLLKTEKVSSKMKI